MTAPATCARCTHPTDGHGSQGCVHGWMPGYGCECPYDAAGEITSITDTMTRLQVELWTRVPIPPPCGCDDCRTDPRPARLAAIFGSAS